MHDSFSRCALTTNNTLGNYVLRFRAISFNDHFSIGTLKAYLGYLHHSVLEVEKLFFDWTDLFLLALGT